jgi:predicted aspartyl protease
MVPFFCAMTVTIPLEIINIENEGFHPHISVKINGNSAVLLLDTGASKTVFDMEMLKQHIENMEAQAHDKFTTGLGTNSMMSHTTTIDLLELGEIQITEFDAVLLDLSHVNQSYEMLGVGKITGVLGSDLLVDLKATINFSENTLLLQTH